MTKVVLKLFISGQTPRSNKAVKTVKEICNSGLKGQCELSVIDVFEFPEVAEAEKVIATPTLIKINEPLQQRIIGDLSDYEWVIQRLGIG